MKGPHAASRLRAGEDCLQLMAVLVGLAPLLTRAGAELTPTRQAAEMSDSVKRDIPVA